MNTIIRSYLYLVRSLALLTHWQTLQSPEVLRLCPDIRPKHIKTQNMLVISIIVLTGPGIGSNNRRIGMIALV